MTTRILVIEDQEDNRRLAPCRGNPEIRQPGNQATNQQPTCLTARLPSCSTPRLWPPRRPSPPWWGALIVWGHFPRMRRGSSKSF